MSVYTYPESKIIDEVTFNKSDGGHTRAYVHAVDGADKKQLQDIMCTLADRGWQVTPYSINAKPQLEVYGFKNERQLLTLLEQSGLAKGRATHVKTAQDKHSFAEQIKKRSLQASGAFYLVGDASFTRYGYQSGNDLSSRLNMIGGLLYFAGTGSLLAFGRKDPSDLQVRDISKKMASHFRDLDLNLPEDCSLSSITQDHQKGLLQKADDLFRRYPSEMMNLFFAAAGACIAMAAYKSNIKGHASAEDVEQVFARHLKKMQAKNPAISHAEIAKMRENIAHKVHVNHRREGWLDIGLGTMTGASGLLAMMVEEKAHDPDAPKKEGIAKLWQTIQEKPLAVAGVGYMVSTMCHAVSTAIAWNYANDARRKSVPWRALFVGANLVAEVLVAMSSKGHGAGVKSDKSVNNTVISLAADLIVKQPRAMQNYLIDHMAKFLGRSDVLAVKDTQAADLLRTQVEAMRNNPWALADVGRSPPPAPEILTDSVPAWQSRLSAERNTTTQPQIAG